MDVAVGHVPLNFSLSQVINQELDLASTGEEPQTNKAPHENSSSSISSNSSSSSSSNNNNNKNNNNQKQMKPTSSNTKKASKPKSSKTKAKKHVSEENKHQGDSPPPSPGRNISSAGGSSIAAADKPSPSSLRVHASSQETHAQPRQSLSAPGTATTTASAASESSSSSNTGQQGLSSNSFAVGATTVSGRTNMPSSASVATAAGAIASHPSLIASHLSSSLQREMEEALVRREIANMQMRELTLRQVMSLASTPAAAAAVIAAQQQQQREQEFLHALAQHYQQQQQQQHLVAAAAAAAAASAGQHAQAKAAAEPRSSMMDFHTNNHQQKHHLKPEEEKRPHAKIMKKKFIMMMEEEERESQQSNAKNDNIDPPDAKRQRTSENVNGSLEGSAKPPQRFEIDGEEDENGCRFRPYQAEQWTEKFEELCKFRRAKGHCQVPHTYVENPPLARWVKRQRYQYKLKSEGKQSTMTDERIEALEKIGFIWDSHAAAWAEKLNELKDYTKIKGNCNVPSTFPENPQLATWVKCQRRQYKLLRDGKTSNMTLERIMELEKIGFVWEVRKT